MRRFALAAALVIAMAGVASAGPSQIASLSNFDVYNQTGNACDGFEIRLSGVSASDVYHTYNNPDFGAPTVLDSGGDTIVTYSGHQTQSGQVEHFGVSLNNAASSSTYRWTQQGADCAPTASEVPFPNDKQSFDGSSVHEDISNDSPNAGPIWVQRRVINTNHAASLEELMTNSPDYNDASEIDSQPERLDAGETLQNDDSIDKPEDVHSAVTSIDVYADSSGQPGAHLGTIINAAVTGSSNANQCAGLAVSVKPAKGKGGRVRPTGTVRIAQKAASGGVTVMLSTDQPNYASVPTSVTIANGKKAARFRVSTHPVPETETVDVQAACGSIDVSAPLTLTK